ncbi:MAG: hypothetical protein GYA88_05525 [Clostridiales bacterium]|nr:hypothetical protein [Clostridiales bacterium]
MMKNKNLKEVICGVIAVAAVFLSACGQTNDKKLDSTPEPSAEVAEEPAATPSQVLEEVILIIDDEKKTITIRYEDFDVSKIEDIVLIHEMYETKIYTVNSNNDVFYVISYDVLYFSKALARSELDEGYELIIENEPTLVKKQG